MAKKRRRPTKTQTMLDKNSTLKYIAAPCILVLIASCIFLFWYNNNKRSTYENIDYIRSFMTSNGRLNDFQNKLGMHDPATDIKWFKTEDEIRIEYGRIVLTWEPEDFFTEDNTEHIATIGFTYDIKYEGIERIPTLHLYYCGEEVERWLR